MKKIKYSIVKDKHIDGLPTYFILKSVYFFGINMFGMYYGIDGSSDIPFQELDSAINFKNFLENDNI